MLLSKYNFERINMALSTIARRVVCSSFTGFRLFTSSTGGEMKIQQATEKRFDENSAQYALVPGGALTTRDVYELVRDDVKDAKQASDDRFTGVETKITALDTKLYTKICAIEARINTKTTDNIKMMIIAIFVITIFTGTVTFGGLVIRLSQRKLEAQDIIIKRLIAVKEASPATHNITLEGLEVRVKQLIAAKKANEVAHRKAEEDLCVLVKRLIAAKEASQTNFDTER